MEFNDKESEEIDGLMEHYGFTHLTELIRYCMKQTFNAMIYQQERRP